MNDEAEYKAVLEAIRRVASVYPQLRVGQIVANATYNTTGSFDPFNISNDALITALNKILT